MLKKSSKSQPKSTFSLFGFVKTGAKVIVAAELLGLAVSYGIWHRLNTNQDFRIYMNTNFPILLEGFYKTADLLGTDTTSIRAADFNAWQQKQNQSQQQYQQQSTKSH